MALGGSSLARPLFCSAPLRFTLWVAGSRLRPLSGFALGTAVWGFAPFLFCRLAQLFAPPGVSPRPGLYGAVALSPLWLREPSPGLEIMYDTLCLPGSRWSPHIFCSLRSHLGSLRGGLPAPLALPPGVFHGFMWLRHLLRTGFQTQNYRKKATRALDFTPVRFARGCPCVHPLS